MRGGTRVFRGLGAMETVRKAWPAAPAAGDTPQRHPDRLQPPPTGRRGGLGYAGRRSELMPALPTTWGPSPASPASGSPPETMSGGHSTQVLPWISTEVPR